MIGRLVTCSWGHSNNAALVLAFRLRSTSARDRISSRVGAGDACSSVACDVMVRLESVLHSFHPSRLAHDDTDQRRLVRHLGGHEAISALTTPSGLRSVISALSGHSTRVLCYTGRSVRHLRSMGLIHSARSMSLNVQQLKR